MAETVTTQVWILATLFGGAGAALLQLVVVPIKNIWKNRKLKAHLRREVGINIGLLAQNIEKLVELKEEHIKLDRAETFYHYFVFKNSSVLFRALINAGVLYDYMTDEQMLAFDNFLMDYTNDYAKFLNEDITKIKTGQYNKTEAANRVDFYISRLSEYRTELQKIKDGI
jgi:hypothetical protein